MSSNFGKGEMLNLDDVQVHQIYDNLVQMNFHHFVGQFNQLSEVNHHLTGQVKHLTDVNHQLSSQLNLLTQDNHQLSGQLNHLTQVNHQFTTQLNQLNQVNNDLTSQLNQLSRVNHHLTCQIDQMTQCEVQPCPQFDILPQINHQLTAQFDQLLVANQACQSTSQLEFDTLNLMPNPATNLDALTQVNSVTGPLNPYYPAPPADVCFQKLRERIDLSFYKPDDTRIIIRPYNYVKVLGRETIPAGKKRKEFYNEFVLPEGIPVMVSWYPSGHVYIEACVRKEPQIANRNKKSRAKKKQKI